MSAAVSQPPDDAAPATRPSTSFAELWLGSPGSQIRVIGQVQHVSRGPGGLNRYLIKDEETGAAIEWVAPKRQRLSVGDRIHMAGVVRRHDHLDETPLTVLHHCFNPMRLS